MYVRFSPRSGRSTLRRAVLYVVARVFGNYFTRARSRVSSSSIVRVTINTIRVDAAVNLARARFLIFSRTEPELS